MALYMAEVLPAEHIPLRSVQSRHPVAMDRVKGSRYLSTLAVAQKAAVMAKQQLPSLPRVTI